jgi:hypothetical protein
MQGQQAQDAATPAVAPPESDLAHAEREINRGLAELLMLHTLGRAVSACDASVASGDRFYWKLSGELESLWELNLEPGTLGITRATVEIPRPAGGIEWELSRADLLRVFRGEYGIKSAYEAGKLRVFATRNKTMALQRLFNDMAKHVSAIADPVAALTERFNKSLQENRPAAGSSLLGLRTKLNQP